MKTFPTTKKEWIALTLFPFKAYVVIVFPFYLLFYIFCRQPLFSYVGNNTTVIDRTANQFLEGFVFCGAFLLLGFVIQLFVSDKKFAIRTLKFAIAPGLLLFFFLSLWVIQHAL